MPQVPKFCKVFADVGETSRRAIESFKSEVASGAFPADEYSPYEMPPDELAKFNSLLQQDRERRAEERKATHKRLVDADEYETISLY